MAIHFEVIEDTNGNIAFATDAEGNDVIRAPLLNKGTAFTKEERDCFGLNGLLPPRILSIEQYFIRNSPEKVSVSEKTLK